MSCGAHMGEAGSSPACVLLPFPTFFPTFLLDICLLNKHKCRVKKENDQMKKERMTSES